MCDKIGNVLCFLIYVLCKLKLANFPQLDKVQATLIEKKCHFLHHNAKPAFKNKKKCLNGMYCQTLFIVLT